jgi:iron complex transport system ATP-binding protein
MNLPIPGITVAVDQEAAWVASVRPLTALASSLVGGGLTQARHILNLHVDKDYHHPNPAEDLLAYAQSRGVQDSLVGMMTAAYVDKARPVVLDQEELTVCAIVTAGLSNATAAGISLPARTPYGTINTILLVDAHFSPAALVNAVITATEAKCDVLRRRGRLTTDGEVATGTSTDAIVIATTGRGEPLPYAGPATRAGWLIARAVRRGLEEALG